MSTLYDPRISAACLALREDPPAALDGPILQYARDALAAAAYAQRASPSVWRRRTFAAIVAFIGVISAASLWQRTPPLAPQATAPAPTLARVAPAAPVVIVTPARARLEAQPIVEAVKPATAVKKKRAAAPPVVKRTPAPQALVPAAEIPDEPVQVKTIAVDDGLAPEPIAPAEPPPAIEDAPPPR
jgi:hypothetical protein